MTHSLFFRGASIALTVLLLFPSLAAAAGSAPLGTMRSEGAVFVDASRVPSQSTVFSGDRVATAEGRASVVLARGSSVLIDRASDAALRNSPGCLTVDLMKGRVTFQSAPQAPVQVETAGLTVAAAGKFPSLAEVAMLANGAISLNVHRGAMTVRKGNSAPVVVQAGRALTLTPQVPQRAKEPGTAAHGSSTASQALQGFHLSHAASVMVIGAAVVATAVGVGVAIAAQDDETPASPAVP
jgi:ferric-dicitrate binding protein FerR (iron transport regulator)